LKVLSIDTTSPLASLALCEGQELLAEASWEGGGSHTEQLPRQLSQLLKTSRVSLEVIDLFAVAKGPGSFTGIRIGMAFVKGLCLLSKKPVAGISTLEAMAYMAPSGLVGPLLDARRDQIFAALYRRNLEGLEVLIEEQAEFPDLFFQKIKKMQGLEPKSLSFLGNGAQKYAGLAAQVLGWEPRILSQSPALAPAIASLAFDKSKRGLTSLGGFDLRPSYLRGSAAEGA